MTKRTSQGLFVRWMGGSFCFIGAGSIVRLIGVIYQTGAVIVAACACFTRICYTTIAGKWIVLAV